MMSISCLDCQFEAIYCHETWFDQITSNTVLRNSWPGFLLTARRIKNLNSGTNSITFVTFHRNIPSKKFKNIGPIGTTWNPPITAVWNPSALFYPKEFWNVLDWDPKLHPFSLSFLWTMNNAHSTRNNVKFVQLTNTIKHLHC